MELQELIQRFKISRRNGPDSYQCICPEHQDKQASLTITQKDGKLLLHCHAGCDTQTILEEVGLTFQDLGNYQPPKLREKLEFAFGKPIEAIYDYRDETGRYLYSKVRFQGKEIRYFLLDWKNDRYLKGRQGYPTTLYNLPALLKTIKAGFPVYIVEGEKDVETLRKLGYTATTAGGVNDWKVDYARYFTGAKVVILPDNDEPGLALKDEILRSLKHFAHSIRWTITSEAEKGDVSDFLLKEGHSKEELNQLVEAAPNIGAPWLFHDEGRSGKIKINGDILADSISRGLPYLVVRQPDDDKDLLYVYDHGVYSRCNRNKMKSIIRQYVPVGMASDNMINNVYNLLLCTERNICTFRHLDTDEWYINLRNGLYNIETKQLEPHTPKVRSTIQLNCEYQPDDKNRVTFDRYMNDLCRTLEGNVDEERKAVLQEFGGLSLSNIKGYRIKLALTLYSALGNSGKTQFANILTELLGPDKVANIPIQHMNEDSKFAMGSIPGKRLICIGDQTGSEIKDSALFKQMTGGDLIKVEQKGKQPFAYTFPGVILIACNNLPSFQDDKGGHVFERLCIVPCDHTIPPEKRDGDLLDKMLKERNAIFNWFLEGLHRLRAHGLKFTKSKACEEAMTEYREKLDTVYRYLSEFYIVTGNKDDMILKSDFEAAYLAWCMGNDVSGVKKWNIKERMEKNGCPDAKANINGRRGVMVYRNLKRKPMEFYDVTEKKDGQQEIPFQKAENSS